MDINRLIVIALLFFLYIVAFMLPFWVARLLHKEFPNDKSIASGVLMNVKFKTIGASAVYIILLAFVFSLVVPPVKTNIESIAEERWKVSMRVGNLIEADNKKNPFPSANLKDVSIKAEGPPVFERDSTNNRIVFYLGRLTNTPSISVTYRDGLNRDYSKVLTIQESQRDLDGYDVDLGEINLEAYRISGSSSIIINNYH